MDGEPGDYRDWLKRLVNIVDAAMAAEGIDAGVRDRVVERVRTGSPGPDPVDMAVIQGLADAAPELPARVMPPANPGVPVVRTLRESRG